ncbi:MAG: glycosyltransferase [Defluviitaleaceae bacterium]|nr:glycosyltransferase [Defluviitaleaceae bacterium]
MITISLCMIVKNEEKILARCLDSIKDIVDEIIIVDTGSTDQTKEIAKKYTDKIFDFEWIEDFSAARNAAFSKAASDYQMWLDADDVFPEESARKLLELKSTLADDVDIVTMKYVTHFDEQDNPVLISTRERLLRREAGYVWIDPVHECIPLIGNVFYSDIEVHHKKEVQSEPSYRNLDIYNNMVKKGKDLSPRQLYYYARELKDHGKWEDAAHYFQIFLDKEEGWIEDNIAACFNLAICFKHSEQPEKILKALLKSFEYDSPRAEVCCELGYFYKSKNDYATALKWFQIAANLDYPETPGFILQDYWGYIPNIESCVCHYHLGNHAKAIKSNEAAAKFKLTPAIEINRRVFAIDL